MSMPVPAQAHNYVDFLYNDPFHMLRLYFIVGFLPSHPGIDNAARLRHGCRGIPNLVPLHDKLLKYKSEVLYAKDGIFHLRLTEPPDMASRCVA